MTMLLDGRLRDLATQTHLLEKKVDALGWNEEIVAGAKAFYEALKPDYYPQWDSDCALRAEYYDAMRLAVKAMQGKATEE